MGVSTHSGTIHVQYTAYGLIEDQISVLDTVRVERDDGNRDYP